MIYFGKPCKHCKGTERLRTNRQCRNCHRLKMERRNRENGLQERGRRRDASLSVDEFILTQFVAHPETGCYLWTGQTSKIKRPVVSVNGKRKLVSRFVMGVHDQDESKVVCHKCDNPMCVREEHLFIGTQKDNVADCVSKGRHVPPPIMKRGVHPNTKIHPHEIPELIEMRNSGMSTDKIGEIFGCSGSIVRRAIRSYDDTGLTT